MMDQTPTYKVQVETQAINPNLGMARIGFQGRGWVQGGMGLGKGCEQIICYNCGGLGNYAHDCTNPTKISCQYCT